MLTQVPALMLDHLLKRGHEIVIKLSLKLDTCKADAFLHLKKSPQNSHLIKLEILHSQFPQQEPDTDRYAMLCI